MFLISQDRGIETLRQRVAEHLKYIPRKKLYRYRKCNEREINTLRHNSIWLIMDEVAAELSVPMLKQTLSENKNTYIYVPYQPDV